MGKLIDANELTEWLKSKIRECVVLNAYAEAATTEEILRYVKHMPAVDAAPVVHGRWIKSEDGDGIVCTACGEDYCDMVVGCNPKEWKFCPVCGAKMDGEVY